MNRLSDAFDYIWDTFGGFILLIGLLLSFMLLIREVTLPESNNEPYTGLTRFYTITDDGFEDANPEFIVDRQTGVQYISTENGVSVFVDSEGEPILADEILPVGKEE